MPWIQHFSKSDVVTGHVYDPTVRPTILIQIKDHHDTFGKPFHNFVDVWQFDFDDIEDESEPYAITDEQAKLLADVLRNALKADHNVAVHCAAGICRSSAVAVVGQMIGFDLEDKPRVPNTLVKKKLMMELGLSFDPNDSPFAFIDFDELS